MPAASRPWIAARLDSEPPFGPLLTATVAPRLGRLKQQGVVKRWFFLWYYEQGLHLRVRLQPAAAEHADAVVAELEQMNSDGAGYVRLHRQHYDRTELAFGETRESVLAELLHVATSALALRLLGQVEETGDDAAARRWVLTAATVAVLALRAIPTPSLAEALSAWTAFARRAAARSGVDVRHVDDGLLRARVSTLRATIPRMECALASERAANDAIALLRRARSRGKRGRFVATHALHLFCNEMSLGFAEEVDIAVALDTFRRTQTMGASERSRR